jgi:predicted dehydrogenase
VTSESESSPTRVGIMGVGAVTQIVHLPMLSERPDVDVLAVSDPDRMKAETLGARFEVPRVLSDEEVLNSDEVQAAVICAPNHLHEALAIEALERGKHVLVEKPLAMNAAGVQRVLDAAAAAGRHLAVGLNHRFRPDVGALQSFVAGGELGDLYAVRANSLARKVSAGGSTWRQKPEAGGGALMDLGIPILDVAFCLTGYPRITRVTSVFRSGGAEVEEAATVFAVSESGIAFSVEVSWNLFAEADRHHCRVMGTEGSGSLPPLNIHKQLGGRPMDVTPRQPKARGGEGRFLNSYRRLLDQFVRVVQGKTDAPLPVEQVQLMEVIAAAYRSAEEGREIHLGDS